MKKSGKKYVALIISLIMLFEFIPFSSFSEEEVVIDKSESRTMEALLAPEETEEPEEEEFWEEVISRHIDDYTVTLTVTKEAEFPLGTTVTINPLNSSDYRNEAATLFDRKDNELGSFIRVFDITFWYDGMEIEPLVPVDVKVTFDNAVELEGNNELKLIHLHEDEAAKEIEAETETAETEEATGIESLSFQSDKFSTYIVAEEVVVYTFSESGNNYEVVLKCNSAMGIPQDAVFTVEEITKDSDLYDQYAAQVAAVINPEGGVRMPALLDISLKTAEGEKIQLDNKVQVIVRLTDEDVQRGLQVVHFPGEDPFQGASAVRDAVANNNNEEIEVLDIDSERLYARLNTKENTVTFNTGSFSVFALAYTVDFHYEGTDYSIEGNSQILLSELIPILNIRVGVTEESEGELLNVADVESVTFTDEHVVTVQQVSGLITYNGKENVDVGKKNFLLTSLEPFKTDEVLTIKLTNGKEIVVGVTDASEVDANNGVSNLVTDVTIDAKFDGTNYIFYPDQPYSIHITFKEENKADGQFPTGSSFTYQLPAGFVPSGTSASSRLPIVLSGGDHSGETVYLNFTIDGNGLVTFTWDSTTNPDAFNQLKNALYTQFKLDIECTYSGENGEMNFGNHVTKTAEVRTSGNVYVGKSGKYNPATNCVDYEVTVNSDGITRNVVVQDTITGTALTYKNDAVATSSLGNPVPTPSSTGNGFSLIIPHMADGETVSIKYSAAVNLNGVTDNGNGSLGTVEETRNGVKVTGDFPDVEIEKSGKDLWNKISLSNIGKSGISMETDENGHATVNWTIRANEYANTSMAGHTITDSIDGNSVPMNYNGDGIYVTAYKENGEIACENYLIPWSDPNMTKTATSWTWNVPDDSFNQQKLSYVITYSTDVDVNGRIINTNVNNTTGSDIGGNASAGTTVTPPGGGLTARKKVVKTDVTSKTITWEISFDVPENGLDSAQIQDMVPAYFRNGGTTAYAVDNYINGTITISPELVAGESYQVSTSTDGDNGKEYVVIDFYKIVNQQTVTGLSGTGVKRKVRVQFDTEIDPLWLQEAVDHPTDFNALYHTNNADVILNGQTIGTSASTRIDGNEPGMNKTHGAQTTYQINGNTLPAFPYVITLTGVSDDSFDDQGQLILEDTFNSKYLAFYPQSEDGKGDNSKIGHIFASTSYQTDPIWNYQKETSESVITSPSAGRIVINITRDNIPMDDNGNYYPFYYVYYYLTVKDPIALEKLERAIQTSESGVYELLNKVSNAYFGTVTDTTGYEIPVIDKSILNPQGSNKLNDQVYYENGNYLIDFKLDINPNALTLGDEEELTLIDDYTNLSLDFTTIRIMKVDGNGVETLVTDADGVSWNRDGNRITATLKNSVHYRIYYTARITGETNQAGDINYSNRVEFFGVKDSESHTQRIQTGGEGGSTTYGVTVFKHLKGNASKPLPGAKFKLYKYGAEDENGWNNRPEATTDLNQTGWTFVTDLETDASGVARTTAANQIQKWTWYKLIETEAPTVDGQAYQLKDRAYVFWITTSGQADYEHYVYLNDDVLAINNEPVLPETVDIGVTKTWTGDNGEIARRRNITVRLYANGVPYSFATGSDGQPLPARNDTVKVLPLKEDGTTDGYTWTGLPSGPIYSVVEDGVPGYTTTYSPKGIQLSGSINIKNKYIPDKTFIHVEKNWSNELPAALRADDITVQLKRKVSPNAEISVVNNSGTMIEHFAVPVGSVVNIFFAGKSYDAENNVGGTKPAWALYRGGITVQYGTVVNGELIARDDSVPYTTDPNGHIVNINNISVDADGLTLRLPDSYSYSYTLPYDPNLHLSQTPQVTVANSGSAAYVEDVDYNNEKHYYTINADNNWNLDIDRLVKEDGDGKYVYYIEEVGVNDNTETPDQAGYLVTYSANNSEGIVGGTGVSANDTITVTNAPQTVDAAFSKAWTNIITDAAGVDTLNNTAKLRIVIQLERWYKDAEEVEHKDTDLYGLITLYGDTTTYVDKHYTNKYSETSQGGVLSAKYENLPKKGRKNGKTVEYIYKIVEKRVYLASDTGQTDLLKAGVYSAVQNTTKVGDVYNTVVNNSFPVVDIDVTKEWKKDESGTIINGTPDDGVNVTVQLQRRWRDVSTTYEYTGTMTAGNWSEYANVSGKTLTLTGDSWTGRFEDLPVYGLREETSASSNFSIIEYDYRIAETGVTINGKPVDKYYTTAISVVSVGQRDKSVTITNTETEPPTGDIKLKKIVTLNNSLVTSGTTDVDGTFTFTIVGNDTATASVRKIVEITLTDGVYTATIQEGSDPAEDLDKDGDYFVVSNLPLGEYAITETSTVPAGYNLITTFSVDNVGSTNNATVTLSDSMLTVTVEATNAYAPGVELPATGGPGTMAFSLSGLVLIMLAGCLWMNRKRKKYSQE